MEWLDLLAVQGTLKSLLQHHSSKASVLWHPAFFIVQLSHPYMTTGKTIALTRQTFVGKVMLTHCPPSSPGVCSNSYPLSQWCYPTISSSVTLSSSCLQSFPASGSFQMSQLFASGGQSIGSSASASILPMNSQGWFPLGLTGLISLLSKGLSRVFSSTTIQKHQFFGFQSSLWSKQMDTGYKASTT